jgi:4'-phosphopantetheinyl transferase
VPVKVTPPVPSARAEVHLWQGSNARCGPDDTRVLSPAERERAARLPNPVAARCYVTAHAALRRILGGHLGTAPERVRIGRGPCPLCGLTRHGPPVLAEPGCDLTFSLARSGAEWLLGIGRGHAVGVDLERVRRTDVDAVCRAALSDAERKALLNCGHRPGGCPECFFRCWTRKEAVVKAWGAGVSADLRQVEVSAHRPGPVLVGHGTGCGARRWWRVRDLPVGSGRHAALAVPADVPVRPVVWRYWPG